MKTGAFLILISAVAAAVSVQADVFVIEDISASWAKADGDYLIVAGEVERDDYAHVICVLDGKGKLAGRWEADKYHGWNDACYEDGILYAFGSKFTTAMIQAWKGEETLFSRKLEGEDFQTWKSRIFPLGDKLILLSRLQENPKMEVDERLYVAGFSKRDGESKWSEELDGLDTLLWAAPNDKVYIHFLAGGRKWPESGESKGTVSLVLCRAKDKVDKKAPVSVEFDPSDSDSPAVLADYVLMDDRFVAVTWQSWGWEESKEVKVMSLDYAEESIDEIEVEYGLSAQPTAWFAGYESLYVFTSWNTDGEQNYRIAEYNLEGKKLGECDPGKAFVDAMKEEGWKESDDNSVKKGDGSVELFPLVYELKIVSVGDKDLLVLPVAEVTKEPRKTRYITVIISDWK